jgi:hypothetical protein
MRQSANINLKIKRFDFAFYNSKRSIEPNLAKPRKKISDFFSGEPPAEGFSSRTGILLLRFERVSVARLKLYLAILFEKERA